MCQNRGTTYEDPRSSHVEPWHVLSVSIVRQAGHEIEDDGLVIYVTGSPSAEITGRGGVP